MAKKRNFEKRYMAFIPFVNMLYAGRLAGETRLFGQRMKHAGVFVMTAQIIALLVGAFSIFAEVTLNANYLLKAVSSADGRTVSLVYVTESGGAPSSRFAMFLIGYVNVASYVLSIVELVYSVFLFITASALFRKYAPASYTGECSIGCHIVREHLLLEGDTYADISIFFIDCGGLVCFP